MTTKTAAKPANKTASKGKKQAADNGADDATPPNAQIQPEDNGGSTEDAPGADTTGFVAPTLPDVTALATLSKDELLAMFLKQSETINELQATIGNRKPRERKAAVKSEAQLRKEALNGLWENPDPRFSVEHADEVIAAFSDKDRAVVVAAFPKIVRLLPHNKLNDLLVSLVQRVLAERVEFIGANELTPEMETAMFGENANDPVALLTTILKRDPKPQPKRKTAEAVEGEEAKHADEEASKQEERNDRVTADDAAPPAGSDPDQFDAEGHETDTEGETENND